MGPSLPLVGTTPPDTVEITCGILRENSALGEVGVPLRL